MTSLPSALLADRYRAAPTRPAQLRVEAPSTWVGRLGNGVENRLADRWLGSEQPAYRGQLQGQIGRLANRLAPGHGVLLSGTGLVAIPSALLAGWIPGGIALPETGGSLRVAGLMVRRNDGKLLVTLTFQASESAAYVKGAELSTGLQLGERTIGFKLGAETAAGAELSQAVVVALRFDPTDPQDARCLEQLFSLKPVLQGGGLHPATELAFSRAMDHNRVSTSIGGSLGANVNGTAAATAGAPKDGGTGIAKDTPWRVKAKLGLTGAANVDGYRSYNRDGSTTYTASVEGDVEGVLKLPDVASGKLTSRNAAAFGASYGPDGQLIDLSGIFTRVTAARALLDLFKFNPGGKEAHKTVVTRSLTPVGLAQAAQLIKAGATPLSAYRTVARDPSRVVEYSASTEARSFLLGFDINATLATQQLRIQATLAAGKIDRHSSDNSDPGLRETLMLMAGTPTGQSM